MQSSTQKCKTFKLQLKHITICEIEEGKLKQKMEWWQGRQLSWIFIYVNFHLQAFAIANPIPKFPKRFESRPHYYTQFVFPPQINCSCAHNSTQFQNNIKIQMDVGQLQVQFSTFRSLRFTKSQNSYPQLCKVANDP